MMDAAFFTKAELQVREVELPDGSKHQIHFRELAAIEFRKFQIAENSNDDEKRATAMVALIAASVCEPDGKQAMTAKQAAKLSPFAAKALVNAILEVNGLTGAAKNDSPAEELPGSSTS
jgi:hypothetical protein